MQNQNSIRKPKRSIGFDRTGFQMAILADTGLSASRKAVAHALAVRAKRSTGVCWPSQDLIASDAGCRRSTVNDALNDLVQRGYVERVRRYGKAGQTSTLYKLGLPVSPDIGHTSESDNQTHPVQISDSPESDNRTLT